jgi:hypothetical protein
MNKTRVFGVLFLILVFGILGVAYAAENNFNNSKNNSFASVLQEENENESEDEEVEIEEELEIEIEEENEGDNNGSGKAFGKTYTKKVKEEYPYKVIGAEGEESEFEVRTQTRNKGNETQQKIKIILSNGQNKDIKVLPETASQTAIDKFKSRNMTVVLKEVGEGNNLSVVYEAEGNKTVKFLGLFKVKADVKAILDSETGEIIDVEKPWWYFMAFGKNKFSSEDLGNNSELENEIENNETTANETLVCCKSYGYGSEMEEVNIEYEVLLESDCSVSEDFVGGNKEIVDFAYCEVSEQGNETESNETLENETNFSA